VTPRVRAVLTLGLSVPSRWNPVYRFAMRRQVERDLATALKALTTRHYPDGKVALTDREMAAAAECAGWGATQQDGSYKLVVVRDERPRVKRPTPALAVAAAREIKDRLDG
jgi:hypothetical protein